MDRHPCEVTITAPQHDWLLGVCLELVEARLASSAHVLYPVTTIYRWEGDVHQATEARAFLRSRLDLIEEITGYVIERHPYKVPNVSAVPLVAGNPRISRGSRPALSPVTRRRSWLVTRHAASRPWRVSTASPALASGDSKARKNAAVSAT